MESVAPAFLGWTDACGGVGETQTYVWGRDLGREVAWNGLGGPSCLLAPPPALYLGRASPLHNHTYSWPALLGRLALPRIKEKLCLHPSPPTTLPAWSLSLPSLVGHGPGLYLPGSQLLLKRKLPWAPRPLNANSSFRNQAGLT